jgi:DNA-binding MarR family transcriptional regulator
MNNYQEVITALRRVIRATDLHSKHLVKTAGLTASQVLLMQTIDTQGSATSSELASAISLSQATVTVILDRLEDRGFIQRQRSKTDKRKILITLTEQGQKALQHAPKPLQESFIQQFKQLEQWEQTAIISALQRVAHMMNASEIDASPVLDIGNLRRHASKK